MRGSKKKENLEKVWKVKLNLKACQAWFTPGVKVHKEDSEMCRLVEQPWLQLMCCTVYLPYGHNFRKNRKKSKQRISTDMVCYC